MDEVNTCGYEWMDEVYACGYETVGCFVEQFIQDFLMYICNCIKVHYTFIFADLSIPVSGDNN